MLNITVTSNYKITHATYNNAISEITNQSAMSVPRLSDQLIHPFVQNNWRNKVYKKI